MQLKFTQEEMTQIGHRIQNAWVASKLTQAQLAERCECSEKHLGDIERGVASVSFPLVVPRCFSHERFYKNTMRSQNYTR